MDEPDLAATIVTRSLNGPSTEVTLGKGREVGVHALTQPQICQLRAPPPLGGPLGTDLQDAVEGVDPFIHI